jgi:hypothetical protein
MNPPLDPDDKFAIALPLLGLLMVAVVAWVWRQWERGEIERTFAQREKELRDQDAYIQTIGTGPRLVPRPPLLTANDTVDREARKEKPDASTNRR